MMGGDVTVTSEPGKSSVFTVRLPSGVTQRRSVREEVNERLLRIVELT